MIYCDTSLLVAALTPEDASERVQDWLVLAGDDGLAISNWVLTEFAGAIAMKGRRGELDADERRRVTEQWNGMLASFTMLAITDRHFISASHLVGRADIKLRSADALHLAIAQDAGITLSTLDHGMADAARTLGVKVDDPLGDG